MKRKFLAGGTAVLLAVAGLFATATAADAHTGKVLGSAECEADGTYTVTWTYNATNVPRGVEAETKAMTTNVGTLAPIDGVLKGSQVFLSVWTEHMVNVPGAPVLTGNWSGQFKTTGIPGTYVGDVTTMVQTDWKDSVSEDPTGKVTVDGTCKPPKPDQPNPQTGQETRSNGVCTEPLNGTRTVTDEARTWSQPYVWNGSAWVLGEKEFSDWTTTGTRVVDDAECAPPVTNVCTPGEGTVSTNLNPLWSNVDTRSAGHYEYVENGLHVWTDDNSSQAKVSLGMARSFDLKNTGVIALDWEGPSTPPGVNLFVDFDNNGTIDGTLVYESVYGQDLWLTNGSAQWVKDNAPVNGGGNGSQWHGTIDQWLTKYPTAHVQGIAFSLGSGVLSDGIIRSITVNCSVHTFNYAELPSVVVPEPIVKQTQTVCTDYQPVKTGGSITLPASDGVLYAGTDQDGEGEFYDATSVEWTDVAPGTYTFWAYSNEGYGPIEQELTVTINDYPVVDCGTKPTPTPTVTPTPTATPVAVALASTGGSDAGLIDGLLAGVFLLGLGVTFMALRRQHN